jgi:nudix-type nucleoside diphosphatase (YffH/AdpP family)
MDHDVTIRATQIMARGKAVTKKVTYDYVAADGAKVTRTREVYEQGDSAAVLPIDARRGTVLLARQLRLPAWLNGHTAPLLEACAGRLDGDDPESCIRREAMEELGYRLRELRLAFTAFSSPGFLTEKTSCFLAAYSPADKAGEGGGLAEEGEHIEVVEMKLDEAYALIAEGGIMDAKTIMLLQAAKLEGPAK